MSGLFQLRLCGKNCSKVITNINNKNVNNLRSIKKRYTKLVYRAIHVKVDIV